MATKFEIIKAAIIEHAETQLQHGFITSMDTAMIELYSEAKDVVELKKLFSATQHDAGDRDEACEDIVMNYLLT